MDKINNKTITGTWTSNFPGPMVQRPWPRPAGCQVSCPAEAARASGGARAAAEARGLRGVGGGPEGLRFLSYLPTGGPGPRGAGPGFPGPGFLAGGWRRVRSGAAAFGLGRRLQSPPRGEGEAERAASPPKGRGWRKDVRSEGQIECIKLA